MASLHKLLSEQGFEPKPKKKVKFKDRNSSSSHHHHLQEDSVTLPIFICRDRRSFDASSLHRSEKASSLKSSRKGGSSITYHDDKPNTRPGRGDAFAAIDDVAIKAVVSILSGFVGQYSRDGSFRRSIREKCRSCFQKNSDGGILSRMELGIQSIDSLVQNQENMDLDSLQNAIKLLKIIASLDSNSSHLSACARLYLSIVYKITKNDKVSARHLLQVFTDSPFLARTHLLPELWEHFFLPHLLHLKIWYTKELEFLSSSDYVDKERNIKGLNELYNDQMDSGTVQFALYYREWLKVGGQAPSIPSVPLPSKPSYARSRRRSSETSVSHQSISNNSLYQAVFGHNLKGRSMDLDNPYGALGKVWDLEEDNKVSGLEDGINHCSHVEKKALARHHRRSSSQSYRIHKSELWPESQKPDFLGILACRTSSTDLVVQGYHTSEKIKHDENLLQSNEIMSEAIANICTSESLNECEMAIRTLTEGWMKSQLGDPTVETKLSEPSVIQGIMEVLLVSEDDEILELAISILAELAARSEMNRQCILNADPQLEASIRLLRSNNLFLKAAALLYQLKPKAKQMISIEWIPLALRVLEFGDQLQILFSVRCNPHEVAYYLLDQLITGFDEDKNFENAKQIISLGGLCLLTRRMDVGDTCEKCKAVSVLYYCIRAEGSCRYYLAKNLKKENFISFLVLKKKQTDNSHGHALALLTELLCLSRTNQRLEALTGLRKGWNCLNTMHILLSYLQRARPEEQPIVGVILLLLDLMGDPSKFSIYREDAIDAIVKALDCCIFDESIQEQTARALLILGGQFSYSGQPDVENWMLRKAGFCTGTENPLLGKEIITNGYMHSMNEEDIITENWQRKAATVLLTSGNSRLLTALSDSIANSIPCLSRASLVTVCWMSNYGLISLGDKDLQLSACSILAPQLIESLSYDRAIEERILACFSLLGLARGTDYLSRTLSLVEKEVMGHIRKLSRVTWTAKELISVIRSR